MKNIQSEGSSLTIEYVQPVDPGDTISLTGRVVDKRQQDELKVVTCRMVVENRDGLTVAEAVAEVYMP